MAACAWGFRWRGSRGGGRGHRGAAAVEFAMLLPVVVLLIGVVAGGARIWFARATVQQVADSAARAASSIQCLLR